MYVPTLPQTMLQRLEQASSPLGPPTTQRSFLPPSDYRSGVRKEQLSIKQQLAAYTGNVYSYVNRKATCLSSTFPEIGLLRKQADMPADSGPLSKERQTMLQALGIYVENDENWEPLKEHRLIDLLHKPTPEPDSSWMQFAFEVHLFWSLCGEVWIWKVPDQVFGLPVALWVIPNDMIRPAYEYSSTGQPRELAYYEVVDTSGQVMHKVPVEQIMRGRQLSPVDKGGAYSATQAAAAWIKSAEAIDYAQYSSFATDVHADVAVLLDAEVYPNPDQNDLDLLRQLFMSRASGLDNKGALILPPGIQELKQLRTKPNEMDYKQSGGVVRDNLGSVWGMNKFSIGISEDMNRGDTGEVQVGFWTMVGDPANASFGDLLTTQLAKDFDERLIVCFRSGMPIDPEQQRLDDALDWQMASVTIDERRKARGKTPFNKPWSQVPYLTSSLVPADLSSEVVETGMETSKMAAQKPDDGTQDGKAADGNKPGASDGRAKKVEKKAKVAKDD